jgi:hypothetical protein
MREKIVIGHLLGMDGGGAAQLVVGAQRLATRLGPRLVDIGQDFGFLAFCRAGQSDSQDNGHHRQRFDHLFTRQNDWSWPFDFGIFQSSTVKLAFCGPNAAQKR